MVVPCALVQSLPHVPQFDVSVLRFTSQPFAETPSQFAYPVLQLSNVQTPVPHDSLALARSQTVPQAPQLESDASEVSQPLIKLPSQLPQRASQTGAQVPDAQLVEPWALLQPMPQPPQLDTSEFTLISHPLLLSPSQFAYGLEQLSMTQLPNEHAGVALVNEQTVLQPPQLLTSVCVLTSHPSPTELLQSAKPELQVTLLQLPC